MRFRRKIGLSLLSAMLLLGSLGGVPHVHVYADEHKVMVLPFENNVEDQSGLGNHGTIVGDEYTYVDGVIGKALKLEGNAYLELGTGSALHPEAMTLAFWIRPNGPLAGEHVITRAESAGGGQVWHLPPRMMTRRSP